MTGAVRPLARYAWPSSRRNRVGEIVSRPVPGRSTPRGASAPPQIRASGADGLHGVVRRREQRQVGGRGGAGAVEVELRQPEAVQVRLVADDQVAEAGLAVAIAAAYEANSACASGVSGVVRDPAW